MVALEEKILVAQSVNVFARSNGFDAIRVRACPACAAGFCWTVRGRCYLGFRDESEARARETLFAIARETGLYRPLGLEYAIDRARAAGQLPAQTYL